MEPRKLFEQLRSAGRLEEVREDLAARQAIDLIAAAAKAIPLAQAEAREQLWTPEKDDAKLAGASQAGAAAGKLWTPTDQGSAS